MKRLVFLVLACLLLLSGCGKQEEPQYPELILRYADNQPKGYPTTLAAEYFAQLVEKRTQGNICIRVYDNGELGDENSVLEQVQFGGIDFTRVSMGTLSEYYPDVEILQLPYLYNDADHMWRVLDGPIGENFLAQVRAADVVGLSWFDAGARSFYTREPIDSLEDILGLSFRVLVSVVMCRVVRLLGANPVQIPYNDVYSALQTAAIDGAENNWPSYESTGHFEAAPYFLRDEHSRLPEMQVMSAVAVDRILAIDEDYLDIVQQCAKESALYERALWEQRETESEAFVISLGCVVTELEETELEKFRQAVQPIYDGFRPELRTILEQIRSS